MTPTKRLGRSASTRERIHPIARASTLLACLLAAFGVAFSSGADGAVGAQDPTPIEFESSGSEPTSGDSLEESYATQSIRRLRPRQLERAARSVDRPRAMRPLGAPSRRASPRPAIRAGAGRDLLIRQQRFLI